MRMNKKKFFTKFVYLIFFDENFEQKDDSYDSFEYMMYSRIYCSR